MESERNLCRMKEKNIFELALWFFGFEKKSFSISMAIVMHCKMRTIINTVRIFKMMKPLRFSPVLMVFSHVKAYFIEVTLMNEWKSILNDLHFMIWSSLMTILFLCFSSLYSFTVFKAFIHTNTQTKNKPFDKISIDSIVDAPQTMLCMCVHSDNCCCCWGLNNCNLSSDCIAKPKINDENVHNDIG